METRMREQVRLLTESLRVRKGTEYHPASQGLAIQQAQVGLGRLSNHCYLALYGSGFRHLRSDW